MRVSARCLNDALSCRHSQSMGLGEMGRLSTHVLDIARGKSRRGAESGNPAADHDDVTTHGYSLGAEGPGPPVNGRRDSR